MPYVFLVKSAVDLLIKIIKFILYTLFAIILVIILVVSSNLTPQLPSNQPITQIDPPSYLIPLFVNAGAKYGIPWQFLATINRIETNYGSSVSEVSSAGALGPMQFMPSTWVEYGKGSPFDYVNAVMASAKMFKQLGMNMTEMNGKNQIHYVELYAGSYNAGAGNWDNMSFQTVNYRQNATLFYELIKNTVKVPSSLITDWKGLTSSQLRAIVNKTASIYPNGYKGKKVKESANLTQLLPKSDQKVANNVTNKVTQL